MSYLDSIYMTRVEKPQLTTAQMASLLTVGLIVIGSLLFFPRAVIASITGVSLQDVTNFANFMSGVGSIALVIITFEYTRQTRRMADLQQESERRAENERWYRETLTYARLAESRWEDLYRKGPNEGRLIQLDEYPDLQDNLREKMDQFERQWSGRPPAVPDEMVSTGEDVFRRWRRLRRIDDPFVDPNRSNQTELKSLVAQLRRQLEAQLEDE